MGINYYLLSAWTSLKNRVLSDKKQSHGRKKVSLLYLYEVKKSIKAKNLVFRIYTNMKYYKQKP